MTFINARAHRRWLNHWLLVTARSVCKTKHIRLSPRNVRLEHPEATCQRHRVLHTLAWRFLFVSLLSFAFGFSWTWAVAAIVVSSLLMLCSGFVLKWSLSSTTTMLGTFYTMISYFCHSWHQNCHTAIQKLLIWKFLKRVRQRSLVLDNSIAYMGSWMLLTLLKQ